MEKQKQIIESESVESAVQSRVKLDGPHLRYITKALTLLHDSHAQKPDERRRQEWGDVYTSVKPFSGALELSDNIKEAVRSYVVNRLPSLKEKIPSIEKFSDDNLLGALVNNWLSDSLPEVEGQRREVLVAVMAHVVKRIETTCYRKILENATPEHLDTLGLDEKLRTLVVELLEVSLKTDPLFIRFLAYSQLSGDVPENATSVSLHLPDDRRKRHTLAELFPHETGYLSAHLSKISSVHTEELKRYPGGEQFGQYLSALGEFYGAKNSKDARRLYKNVQSLHKRIAAEGFPIVLTPPAEGYYKEPYVDPELVVSIATKDAKKEERGFQKVQHAYASVLHELALGEYSEHMEAQSIRSVVALGAYGVNTVFRAVAQENPILMYLNEQIRAYDRDFPEFLEEYISNTGEVFGNNIERRTVQELMSRTNTILHELSHSPLPTKDKDKKPTDAGKRFGPEAETIIDEVKAEILYHALIPEILERGGLEGTKEQWAVATLGSTLQGLRDSPPGDPYYYNATYVLNDLMRDGVVAFDGNQTMIIDFERYYSVLKGAAREVISLYADPNMNEKKALSWIKKRCRANEHVKQVEDFLKMEVGVYDSKKVAWSKIKDEILSIEKSAFDETQVFGEEILKRDFEDPDNVVVVIKNSSGKIVGFTYAKPTAKTYPEDFPERKPNEDTAYIYDTAIEKSYQGKKLVRLLLKRLDQELVDRGYSFIERDSSNSRKNGSERQDETYTDKIRKKYKDKIVKEELHDSEYGPQVFFKIKLA